MVGKTLIDENRRTETRIECIDKVIEELNNAEEGIKFDYDFCNKILKCLNNLIHESLYYLNQVILLDKIPPTWKKIIFAGIMATRKDGAKTVLTVINADKYWNAFRNYEEDDKQFLGKQITWSKKKPPNENEILTGIMYGFKGITGSGNKAVNKILKNICTDEEFENIETEFENLKECFETGKLEGIQYDVLGWCPYSDYGFFLLSPRIIESVKKLYSACKVITHGYGYEKESRYSVLFQKGKDERTIPSTEIEEILKGIGSQVRSECNTLDKIRWNDDANADGWEELRDKELSWWPPEEE